MQNKVNFKKINAIDEPELLRISDEIVEKLWPEFMLHDEVANQYWERLFIDFPEYQFILVDNANEEIIATANSIPVNWTKSLDQLPDKGWDWVLELGMNQIKNKTSPNIQCALSITVSNQYVGKGISTLVISEMASIGKSKGFKNLIAPVRPNHKDRYPLISMTDYIKWDNGEGLPFDPWLRVHTRFGGRIINVCHKAMKIQGSIKNWEQWSNMKFPQSGDYIIPGALSPIQIDIDKNNGIYIEPNVWMCHDLIC